MIITLALTIVIGITVLLKKHGNAKEKKGYSDKSVAVPTTTNQAYGLAHHSERVEENIYNYPEVNLDTIGAKQNVAYVTNIDVITEGNQAYATNIEKNAAYGPVTSVETADEYDYI